MRFSTSLVERLGLTLQTAWDEGSDIPAGLPPIEFMKAEREFLASAILQDMKQVLAPAPESDSDGTRSAETACPAPVPQDCQARADRHRPTFIGTTLIRRVNP